MSETDKTSELDRIVANLGIRNDIWSDDTLEDIKYTIACYALDSVYDSSICAEAINYCKERESTTGYD